MSEVIKLMKLRTRALKHANDARERADERGWLYWLFHVSKLNAALGG